MSTAERWKTIEEYPWYEVSNLGRVCRISTGRILKPGRNSAGYYTVYLYNESGKGHSKTVHRLVGLAFIPNPGNRAQVNHRFGDKSDNRASMLEWNTQQENQDHAWRIGLCRCRRRKFHPSELPLAIAA
jgi:hypothetical protein